MKILIRIVIWTSLALAALGVAAIALTSTPWFQRALERRLSTSLASLAGGRVEIAGMRFHPLLIEMTIDRLTLRGREQSGELPLFAARGLVVQISPASLLHFQLRLRNLSWKQAEISVSTCPGCGSGAAGQPAGPTLGQAVRILLNLSAETATLANTDIYWNGKELPLQASGTDLAILLRRAAPGHYVGSLASSGITLRGKFGILPKIELSTQVSFTKSGAKINALAWRLGDVRGNANGSVVWEPAVQSQFHFAAAGGTTELAQLLHLSVLQRGRISIGGEGTYENASLRLRGRAEGSQLEFQSGPFKSGPVSLSFAYAVANRNLKLSNLTLKAIHSRIQGSADVRLVSESPTFSVWGKVDRLDVASLFQSLGGIVPALQMVHPAANASGSVEGNWTGAFQDLGLRFDVALRPSPATESKALPLSGTLKGTVTRQKSTRVSLEVASFKTPHSAIQLLGRIGPNYSPLSFQIVTTDLEEWRPLLEFLTQAPLSAALSLQQPASFSGTFSELAGRGLLDGRLETGRFESNGWIWSHLDARVQLSRGRLQLSEGRLQRGKSTLTFSGTASLKNWQLMDTSTLRLALAADRSPLGGLVAETGIHFPLDGDASGKLTLTGTAQSLSGSGAIRVQDLRLGRESFPSASAGIRVAGGSWKFEDIRITQGPGLATGTASLNRSARTFSVRIEGSKFSLADFIPSASAGERRANPPLRGSASFSLLTNGTFDSPSMTLSLSVGGLTLYGDPVGDLDAQIHWQGKAMAASGFVRGTGGEIHFAGSARTSAEWPLTLAGTFQGLEIGPWIHLISGRSISASVAATGTFDLSGPLKDLRRMQGRSEIARLKIRMPPLSFENDRPVMVRYAESALRFSPFHMKGPGTDFSVQGVTSFGAQPKLALDVTGRADATLLSLANPSLQAVGGSQLELHLGGTPEDPSLRGSMTIRDVNVSYSDLPIRLSGLNGIVSLQGDRTVISSLRGVIGGGDVSLSGFVTLGALPRYEIRARLRQVRVRYPRDFTSVLDGGLFLAGSQRRGEVSGEVAVRNLFVTPGFNPLTLIAESNNRLEAASTATPSLASRIRLNIRVSSPQGVRLETRDVHLAADVDLHLRGTLANPVALGDIHARSGNAIFQGNRYTIARGDLSMNNPFRTEPLLDLQAQTRVERYDLTLEVTGPLDQLHVAYRSDPPLPVEDIVSLMALGYSRRAEESGTAPTNNRALSSSVGASALLSQALSSEVGGRIQQLFGVSRIKINPDVNEPGVGAGPRVTVEQQLTPDFTVTYITNTTNSLYRVIRFEWDLGQDVSLIGMRDRNGIIGMELKFRRRFN
jgi:translocation and assembly module TamB